MGLIIWTKIDTTLEPKLDRKPYDFNPSIIALFYTIQFIGYLIVSPYCHKLLQIFNGTLCTLVCFYLLGIASLMAGPSYVLENVFPVPDTIALVIPGLILTGLATSFTTIGTYHEMQMPYLELYGGDGTDGRILLYDKDKIGDILAGLYNSASSIGVIIGPLSASYIMIALGDSFRKMHDIFAAASFIYATILLVVVYIPGKFKNRQKK
jgi:MFS family permease